MVKSSEFPWFSFFACFFTSFGPSYYLECFCTEVSVQKGPLSHPDAAESSRVIVPLLLTFFFFFLPNCPVERTWTWASSLKSWFLRVGKPIVWVTSLSSQSSRLSLVNAPLAIKRGALHPSIAHMSWANGWSRLPTNQAKCRYQPTKSWDWQEDMKHSLQKDVLVCFSACILTSWLPSPILLFLLDYPCHVLLM